MANWCDETVQLFGPTAKIVEVIEHIKNLKKEDYDDESFGTEAFPNSICRVHSVSNSIDLLTKDGPVPELQDLSKKFPDVGFITESFTEGDGGSCVAYLKGGLVYLSTYISLIMFVEWYELFYGKSEEEKQYFSFLDVTELIDFSHNSYVNIRKLLNRPTRFYKEQEEIEYLIDNYELSL